MALSSGAILVREAASRAKGSDAGKLLQMAKKLEQLADEKRSFYENPCDEELERLMRHYPDLTHATKFETELPVRVDRERARFSAWYEMFPRRPRRFPAGTDVCRCGAAIARNRGDGVRHLYLPPIHPIGRAFRKGPNNATVAPPDAPGSPWAIGDRAAVTCAAIGAARAGDCGGHKSIHPSSAHSLISIAWLRRQSRRELRSRWILRSSVRPIIHGSTIIPIGSSSGPMGRFNTQRTRPRSIRTSIP